MEDNDMMYRVMNRLDKTNMQIWEWLWAKLCSFFHLTPGPRTPPRSLGLDVTYLLTVF